MKIYLKKGLIDNPDVVTLTDRNDNIIYEKEKEIITFTINGVLNGDGTYTYQAQEGMTWADWIESEFNTIPTELNTQVNGEMWKYVLSLKDFEYDPTYGKCLYVEKYNPGGLDGCGWFEQLWSGDMKIEANCTLDVDSLIT